MWLHSEQNPYVVLWSPPTGHIMITWEQWLKLWAHECQLIKTKWGCIFISTARAGHNISWQQCQQQDNIQKATKKKNVMGSYSYTRHKRGSDQTASTFPKSLYTKSQILLQKNILVLVNLGLFLLRLQVIVAFSMSSIAEMMVRTCDTDADIQRSRIFGSLLSETTMFVTVVTVCLLLLFQWLISNTTLFPGRL